MWKFSDISKLEDGLSEAASKLAKYTTPSMDWTNSSKKTSCVHSQEHSFPTKPSWIANCVFWFACFSIFYQQRWNSRPLESTESSKTTGFSPWKAQAKQNATLCSAPSTYFVIWCLVPASHDSNELVTHSRLNANANLLGLTQSKQKQGRLYSLCHPEDVFCFRSGFPVQGPSAHRHFSTIH